ncbi:transcriptional regulator with PAS, ATPase and Fis domain [Scopulibacillus darangshiensis]|uniref:Transcriptional regulator with PAS, ATPase and Fis domain n=1 Tax=Scopulibacillus darangshiensis TaxID=442528 RepID=A0A4R2P5X1_9BACL|nr:sigma 54-interacting transcriptional regulator [Scopulibacillus darangshiensis]TCP29608.1 transcriptional regulator with PAS, ATPase and Fis domain [Scopulibacillus darangshiensis]
MVLIEKAKTRIEQLLLNISRVLKMDFAIIQADGELVISTNRYRKQKGISVHMPSIERAFDEGFYLMDQPGKMDVCQGCRFQSQCPAKSELLHTIHINNESFGVISLTSFTKDGHQRLIKHQEDYSHILNDITNIIISIIEQEEEIYRTSNILQILQSVLSTSTDPLMICDPTGLVVYQNEQVQSFMKPQKLCPLTINEFLTGESINKVLHHSSHVETTIEDEAITIHLTPAIDNDACIGMILRFNKKPEKEITDMHPFKQINGESPAIMDLKTKICNIKNSSSTVLLTGETGTGKSVFAKAIHDTSQRSQKPFISINCASIPESLFESEMFGYEEGSFTGAKKGGKKGHFQSAHGGTLFLDEIGEVPYHLQAKLLNAIEGHAIKRVGGNHPIPIDIRIIAATNQNLEQLMKEGKFREDLFFRLCVIPLNIPPLKSRMEDVELLAYSFLHKHASKTGKAIQAISLEALEILHLYHWPGNVRELENTMEYALNMETGTIITKGSLPDRIVSHTDPKKPANIKGSFHSYQKELLQQLIAKNGYDSEGKELTAKELGISVRTLYRKIDKYGIKN